MATISKTGIATGQNITATQITNIIDALDGTTQTDISMSGVFSIPGFPNVATSLAAAGASAFSAAGISGSWQSQDFSSLTPAGISGSLGTNATLLRGLTAATISGSFTAPSSSISTRLKTIETNNIFFPFTGSAIISQSLSLIGPLLIDDAQSDDNLYIGSGPTPDFSNATAARNIAIGTQALEGSTSGIQNIAIGYQALESAKDVDTNIAIGFQSLQKLSGSSADNNIAIGDQAGLNLRRIYDNTGTFQSPSENVLLGNNIGSAFDCWRNGTKNLIMGGSNLIGVYGDSPGNDINYCVTAGYQAGEKLRSGSGNVFMGYRAGRYMGGTSDGTIYAVKQNVMIGLNCGDTKTYGNGLTYIGAEIVKGGDATYNETVLGYAVTGLGNNTVAIGNTDVSSIKGQVSFTTYSDERIKRNISSGSLGLEFISTLNPVRFQKENPANYPSEILEERYTDRTKYETIDSYPYSSSYIVPADPAPVTDNGWYDGLIAQEVSSSLSNLGIPSDIWNANETNGKQGIKYETLTIPLIKAVQELSASLSTALDRIATLEG